MVLANNICHSLRLLETEIFVDKKAFQQDAYCQPACQPCVLRWPPDGSTDGRGRAMVGVQCPMYGRGAGLESVDWT